MKEKNFHFHEMCILNEIIYAPSLYYFHSLSHLNSYKHLHKNNPKFKEAINENLLLSYLS